MQPPPSAPGHTDPRALPAEAVLRQVRDDAMFFIDPQGLITSWNEGVGEVLGWPEDRERAYAAGFRLHLAKPGVPSLLVESVDSLRRER